jgi:hypothetical protein
MGYDNSSSMYVAALLQYQLLLSSVLSSIVDIVSTSTLTFDYHHSPFGVITITYLTG